MSTLKQIHKRIKRDRDRATVADMADRFTRRSNRLFIEGNYADANRLRETAEFLRTAPLKQATALLGVLWNEYQGAKDAAEG